MSKPRLGFILGDMLKLRNKKKISLVLSGGGPKAAAFHIGVCLALQEKGFHFLGGTQRQMENDPHYESPLAVRAYVGSSAGALVCSMLASGHAIESIIESTLSGSSLVRKKKTQSAFRSLSYRDMFTLKSPNWKSFLKQFWAKQGSFSEGGLESTLKNYFKIPGLFSARGIEQYIREEVLKTNSFAELGPELYTIATYLNQSKKAVFCAKNQPNERPAADVTYINQATISDGVAASASLPPLYCPWNIKFVDGTEYDFYDGEIRETLSTHVASDNGSDLVIASYSIQPYHYSPEVGSLSKHGIPLIANQAIYQVIEQKIARAINTRASFGALTKTVSGYFREHDLPKEHAERLIEIMSKKVNYRKDVDYVYINPSPHNTDMFFADHFSLNPYILESIAKIGFKSALGVLRKYDI